ncbi:MAG: GNAT family N-acetyltransferase [Planctomycetota bacterium]|jgi:GNAT superfamily N-acetyltransferase
MSTEQPIKVRQANPDDAEVIAALLGELGYPQAPAMVRQRLDELTKFPSARVLVATNGDEVIAVGTLNFIPLLHDHKIARVSALAVIGPYRGKGVGQVMMGAFENIAREAGCPRLEVTSNIRRTGAHGFYERMGYEDTSKRFVKWLAPGA